MKKTLYTLPAATPEATVRADGLINTTQTVVTDQAALDAAPIAKGMTWLGGNPTFTQIVKLVRRRAGEEDVLLSDAPLFRTLGAPVMVLPFQDDTVLRAGDRLVAELPPGVELRVEVIEVAP